MTTPGDSGQRPWEQQPPSGAYEPPPIEHGQPQPGYGAQPPGAAPPPSSYPPPGYEPPPSTPPSYPPSPGGYAPSPPYQSGYPSAPQSRTNGMAIGSLVASVLAFPLGFCYIGPIAAIVGVVLGIIALNQIKQSGENGRGMAIAGIIVGAVILVLSVIVIVFAGFWTIYNPA